MRADLYITHDIDTTEDILVEDVNIVVEPLPPNKTLYSIRYKSLHDNRVHLGYSSYTLKYVEEFFHEYFHKVTAVESGNIRCPLER